MTPLQEIRTEIDALDRQIVTLLAARERLVRRAGRLKTDTAAVRAPGRVEQVVERTYRAMIAAFIDLEPATLPPPGESR